MLVLQCFLMSSSLTEEEEEQPASKRSKQRASNNRTENREGKQIMGSLVMFCLWSVVWCGVSFLERDL
jgi:hypothetical protein